MQEDDGTKLSKTEALWRAVRCGLSIRAREHTLWTGSQFWQIIAGSLPGKWGTKVMWEKQGSWQLSVGVVFCA